MRHAFLELAVDLRHEVRDVRVRLDLEKPDDVHAAGSADAREIVAAEIDEHDVFRAVLLRRKQPVGITRAALGRARDGVQACAPSLRFDERLR